MTENWTAQDYYEASERALRVADETEIRRAKEGPLPAGHSERFPCAWCSVGLGYGIVEGLEDKDYHPACVLQAKAERGV